MNHGFHTGVRRIVTVALLALAVPAGLMVAPVAADASPLTTAARAATPHAAMTVTDPKKVTDSYFKTTHKYDLDVHRCLFVTTSGELKYTLQDFTEDNGLTWYRRYTKFRIGPMHYELYVRSKCADGARKKLSKAHLHQYWYHKKCSLNAGASIGAGTDFEIAVSLTPTCGTIKVGDQDETYEAASYHYDQGTTGNWIKWSGPFVRLLNTNPASKRPCIRGVFKTTAFRHGYDSGHYHTNRSACAEH